LLTFLQHENETLALRHPSFGAYQHAHNYFNDILILPLGNRLVERFLCHAVIHAAHACTAAQQEQEVLVENQGYSLEYNRLAQQAGHELLSNVPCKELSNQIQTRLDASPQVLPMTCLEESQGNWLWNKTLCYHHAMMNITTTFISHDMLKRQFMEASKSTLCQVNVEQVVMDRRPELFVKNKNETTNSRVSPP
jgi:hypothetical protein